jgi:hypothetical protein
MGTVPGTTVPLLTRAEMGLRPRKGTAYPIQAKPVLEGWEHHGGDGRAPTFPHSSCVAIWRAYQAYHMDVREWTDIAYTFGICPHGHVLEGRGWGVSGGHTKDRNTISYGLCHLGDYSATPCPPEGIAAAVACWAWGIEAGWVSKSFVLGPHRAAPGASTSCPGDRLMPQLPTIRSGATAPPGAPPPPPPVVGATANLTVADLMAIAEAVKSAMFPVEWNAHVGTQKKITESEARIIAAIREGG